MNNNLTPLVIEALRQPKDAIFATLRQSLRQTFPEAAIAETQGTPFRIEHFAVEREIGIRDRAGFDNEWTTLWWEEQHRTYSDAYNTWRVVTWERVDFEVLTVGILGQFHREERHFVLGPTDELCVEFIEAVCLWCSEVHDEILVFQDGCWNQDRELFTAIKSTTLDSLFLEPEFKAGVLAEFTQFLSSREHFERYRIPWKRGFLFMGPPGNGKTHMIKGIVNRLALPCLYVRNFTSEYGTDEANIRTVFRRARSQGPCILVFEDLDSMVNDANRFFFLNELDGFEANEGLITLATTNHPERLDPAILNRPSRFDRKFTFGLPSVEDRTRFLFGIGTRFESELRLSESEAQKIAEVTDGYSFAYLKELTISSVMEWIAAPARRPIFDLMKKQAEILAKEMAAGIKDEPPSTPQPGAHGAAYWPRFTRHRRPGRP